MSPAATGVLLGLLAGLGAALAVAGSPLLRRVRLDDRLAPYLREVPPPSALLAPARSPLPVAGRLLRPVLADAVRLLDRAVGGRASVHRRLSLLDDDFGVEEFRTEQVVWGGAGLLAGLLLTGAGAARSASPLPLLALTGLLTVAGVLARDRRLTRDVGRRREQVVAEFPAAAEMLALAVAAGESPVAALERVARLTHGPLAAELGRTVAAVRAGTPLQQALDELAARTEVPAVARFADAVAVAVERGTPLADVLRAQAADARAAGRNALLEAGGRKEIAMLVPVVFLVLPVTVVFLVFPGFYGLGLVVH